MHITILITKHKILQSVVKKNEYRGLTVILAEYSLRAIFDLWTQNIVFTTKLFRNKYLLPVFYI